ncbi:MULTISPECIES: CU044_5270 family protein [unclassified Streptomyces]|uniref:CU044_5270 family protein n=1 Tax=unclassified Streptomyces TaxID=2593676 RepID=UPI002E29A54C|nr:CU044_5270 family protein [Streptomyces sp. NBC_00223]
MNELDRPRALRADAPLPDSDRLAPQRAALVQEFAREAAGRPAASPRIPSPRRRVVLVAVAATAALAVTGGVLAALPGDGTPTATPGQHAPTGRQVLSARASADTLELAAATVEKFGAAEPGPKQWVYEKSTGLRPGEPQTSESWTRWDGTGEAHLPGTPPDGDRTGFDPDKLQVWYGPNQEAKWKKEGYDDRSQRQFYDFLATLPSDPDLMMRRIREKHAIGDIKGETAAERDWREIDVLYRSVLIPPNAQAGLFRALARIPGARVEQNIKDPIGRPAIGVTVTYTRPSASGHLGKQELFFDPRTYAYLAEIDRAAPIDPPKGLPSAKPAPNRASGSVFITARNAWGVVDKPGERP